MLPRVSGSNTTGKPSKKIAPGKSPGLIVVIKKQGDVKLGRNYPVYRKHTETLGIQVIVRNGLIAILCHNATRRADIFRDQFQLGRALGCTERPILLAIGEFSFTIAEILDEVFNQLTVVHMVSFTRVVSLVSCSQIHY